MSSYAYIGSFGTTWCSGILASTWGNLMACLQEYLIASGQDSLYNVGWATTEPFSKASCQAEASPPPAPLQTSRNLWACLPHQSDPTGFLKFTFATDIATCPSTLTLFNVSGTGLRCRSKCWALRGVLVSAFVPINSESDVLTQACLFVVNSGQCEIEAVDTSNYTYGAQIYRSGTWRHVGQQCHEDTSSAPSSGAITSSPTGGTGSGTTTISEGNTATSRLTMEGDISGARSGVESGLEAQRAYIESGVGAEEFMPTGGRWLPNLDSVLPALIVAECELTTGTVPRKTGGDVPLKLSFCSWAPYVQDVLYYVFGVLTMFGLWGIVFNNPSKEG